MEPYQKFIRYEEAELCFVKIRRRNGQVENLTYYWKTGTNQSNVEADVPKIRRGSGRVGVGEVGEVGEVEEGEEDEEDEEVGEVKDVEED